MKTRAVRLYGVDDIRLDTFELPEIKDDEILVKVVSDSICMSTWKTVKQGEKHKRVPNDVKEHPIIIGHEFAGDIVKVGKKWQDTFKPGQKFAQQPAIPGQMESPGYSYEWCGGDTEYCIFPNDILEAGCVWTFDGDSYFASSVAEPVSCCIGGYHTNYHTKPGGYQHIMGTKKDGNLIILGGCGPMGLGAISYGLTYENKPKRIVVTEINDERIERAREVISEEEAKEHGVELIYVNTSKMDDQVKGLMELSEGKGYDDVFVYIPNQGVCEIGNQIMAYDGCMNLFAGPTDPKFSANVNLYDCHYSRSKIIGSTGGTIDDMKEAIDKNNAGLINSAVMITHVGGLDSVVETTKDLPNVPGGKKLVYTHINMPMTAIEDFGKLGESDPFFKELDAVCKANKGLWSSEAEKMLLEHFS
ncbi:alcohol dehydrogenase catalytic domain-containing protein [Dubosiella newyorkensis]|jgi:threonine dehydrogenase-like Zn-dependent dehydrogenase|uniref:L-sorbose 1-phosphate reductase n=3 Tax=Dubosiella newyorkensis TaxID=1862672 RepID=A0A1U7NM96_9FIRM|nr:zinc-binding dehydrogenase [Dubosiella newyorkensis]MCI9041025.1 zinc-binding dehydrogenase [Dubosiella newyorkensis]OLU46214.1 L-sorbose 1-phosphate reductase [Dubosiella newyorkensis]